MESERRGDEHRAGYSDAVTDSTDPDDSSAERRSRPPMRSTDDSKTDEPKKRGALREAAILVTIAVVLYYVMLTFVARPYLIPSESMEPTLHGCTGCVGDRIMVDKLTYRFGSPRARRRDRVQGPAELEHRLQVDPLGQHRGAVGAERAVVRRVRPARRERPGQAGDRGRADRPSSAAPTPA